VQGITPIVSAPATIKARSPQRRPQSRQFSPKVAVQQAVSPMSKADRNGSAAVASLHSSESENSESNSALPVTAASLSTAGTIWRKLLLVSMLFRTVKSFHCSSCTSQLLLTMPLCTSNSSNGMISAKASFDRKHVC